MACFKWGTDDIYRQSLIFSSTTKSNTKPLYHSFMYSLISKPKKIWTNQYASSMQMGNAGSARNADSRHPKICQKLRQHGGLQTDPKGCDGKCDTFHPNACSYMHLTANNLLEIENLV